MIKEQSETNEFVFNRLKENSELMQFDDEKLRLLLIKMQALQAGLSLMARKEQYSNIFSDENINKYLFDAEPLKDISEADEIIEFYLKPEPRSQHRWIIIRKSDGVKLGTCGYHCLNIEDSSVEIGYDLKKEFWANGYMYEALQKIIEFARNTMNVKTINACIYTQNSKSIKLVEKLDFEVSGSKYERFRNKKYLHRIYSLSLDELKCEEA